MKKLVVLFLLFVLSAYVQPSAFAQCAMCTINAEQGVKNGNTQAKGLNNGVLYLLAMPYLLVGGVGTVWYLNYRKKGNDKPAA